MAGKHGFASQILRQKEKPELRNWFFLFRQFAAIVVGV